MIEPHRPEPSLIPIERPHCPTCQARTTLTRLEPGPIHGSELRTFECVKCGHTLQKLAEDPMHSDAAAGWIRSDLAPPR